MSNLKGASAVTDDSVDDRRLMDERELAEWIAHPVLMPDDSLGELLARAGDHERILLLRHDDRKDQETVAAEDRLLLVVGTLCLLNGQRALWSSIYRAWMEWGGEPCEDEWEFLENATALARQASAEADN